MSNITNIMENGTYNLSKIISTDMLENPASWLANFNGEMNGQFIIFCLGASLLTLFFIARTLDGVTDSEAAVASTLVISIVATLLFFIVVEGQKLLSFDQLMIFLVLMAVSVLGNEINKRR